ncbi:hypothetical protein Y1Q_0021096 [Alligator mississippiensis]|uniref:Uncharacterized protein n=1 Tax=Alligator mississippiensis TaxID=8496 RepID=A0A151NRG5_ALLMI|nr:hypothetical protein Y1Q_0021096 [Alligator mississippiensis]
MGNRDAQGLQVPELAHSQAGALAHIELGPHHCLIYLCVHQGCLYQPPVPAHDVQIIRVGQDIGLLVVAAQDMDSVDPWVLPRVLGQGLDGTNEQDLGEWAALLDHRLHHDLGTQDTIDLHFSAHFRVEGPDPSDEGRGDSHLLQRLEQEPMGHSVVGLLQVQI